MNWTDEKIAALSPNDSTERRGKMLANSSKWNYLATNYEAIWGECKGSGSQPYFVQINLSGPQFKCNCPVRKPPCKHILGLFFLYAKSSAVFKYQSPPNLVGNWLEKHTAAANEVVKTSSNLIKTDEALEKTRLAKEKRWNQRLVLMANGIDELELWLSDIVRQGIANTDAQNASFWNQAAAKMVDAKLPKLSSYLKETYQLILQENDWTELVVARLGELYLWVEAFKKRELLSPSLQDELYNALGKTVKKADVLTNSPSTKDNWLVMGKKEGVDIEGGNYRRVWLQGQESIENALLLDYSFGNAGFDEQYTVGDLLKGKLAYYSSNYPQRAVFDSFEPADLSAKVRARAFSNINGMLKAYSQAIAKNPWLPQFPAAIADVSTFMNNHNQLKIKDIQDNILPIGHLEEATIWKILAISGGHPIGLFGEWDGLSFEPLSLFSSTGVIQL